MKGSWYGFNHLIITIIQEISHLLKPTTLLPGVIICLWSFIPTEHRLFHKQILQLKVLCGEENSVLSLFLSCWTYPYQHQQKRLHFTQCSTGCAKPMPSGADAHSKYLFKFREQLQHDLQTMAVDIHVWTTVCASIITLPFKWSPKADSTLAIFAGNVCVTHNLLHGNITNSLETARHGLYIAIFTVLLSGIKWIDSKCIGFTSKHLSWSQTAVLCLVYGFASGSKWRLQWFLDVLLQSMRHPG